MVRRGQILPQQILRNLDGINNHAIGAHGEKTRTQCCRSRSRIIAQSSLESTLKFAVTVSRCARSAPEIHKVSRSSVRQKSACRSPATKKGRCRLHGGASGSGAPPGKRNGQYRHGERTKAAIAERQKFSALLRMLRAGLTSIHKMECGRRHEPLS